MAITTAEKNKIKKQQQHQLLSNKPQRNFLQLQPQEVQQAYAHFVSKLSTTTNPSQADMVASLSDFLRTAFNFPQTTSDPIASGLYDAFTTDTFVTKTQGADAPIAQIPFANYQYLADLPLFTTEDSSDEDAKNNEDLRRLLLAFLIFYHDNFHPTGWVRYDRKNIFFLAGLQKASAKTQERLTSYLHKNYGLEMRVVGSNQPIPCFRFEWAAENEGKEPRIKLGAFTPETVKKSVENIKKIS